MTTVSDARVVRTREALRQAMTELAAENPLDAITVRAIAARAGIGYATFFRHYADKDALLAEVADLLIREFMVEVRPLLMQRDRRGAARTIVTFVTGHLPIYKALITMAATRRRQPEGPLDDFIFFHIVSTILNQLAWWLRHEGAINPEAMAEIIERTVLVPVSELRQSPPKGL